MNYIDVQKMTKKN